MPVKAPPPAIAPVLPWTGAYAGVHGGYAWGHTATDCSFIPGIDSACQGIAFPSTNPKGGLIGIAAGADRQYQNWVFGVVGDFNWLHIHDAGQFPSVDAGKTDQISSRYDWLGTARGRAGVVVGQSLFYGTAGVAFGKVTNGYIHNITGVDIPPQPFSTAAPGSDGRPEPVGNTSLPETGAPSWNICMWISKDPISTFQGPPQHRATTVIQIRQDRRCCISIIRLKSSAPA
jgi:hypothetical protein